MSFTRPLRAPALHIRTIRSHTVNLSSPARRHESTIPYIASCPSPTCACASAPPGLDIDRKSPLMNTMAGYAEQVLICSGKDDWSSRIEDEQSDAGDFIRGLRGVIGKGGKAFDPFNNVLATASSFPTSSTPNTTTALLFPSFQRISAIPHSPTSLSNFATAFLKARRLHPMHDALSQEQKANLLRDESVATELPAAEPITKPIVLICGHGGRDKRCGILGPILRDGFGDEFARRGIDADVGLISHIGGHKYAGNVIIYLPPTWKSEGDVLNGTGIWYGRVGPENVEGVVGETVVNGKIIADLFRGGVSKEKGNIGRILEEQIKKDRGEEDGGFLARLRLRPRARGGAAS